MDNQNERDEELSTLAAIFPELRLDEKDQYSATLELPVTPTNPLLVRFVPTVSSLGSASDNSGRVTANTAAYIEHDVPLSHLPPLIMKVNLPPQYPADSPPKVRLAVEHDWLPSETLTEIEGQASVLWKEYGGGQTLFAYIDYLQQAAERAFDLDQCAEGCLILPTTAEAQLVGFDLDTKQSIFNAGTYDCGICLEPKKGSECYRLPKCGHVFCKTCLQDFYNAAITEGDVANVKCLSPDCGKTRNKNGQSRKSSHTLHPHNLLAMGIEEAMVRRYVELKRKKKIEADAYTVYCPRKWCQGAAKSPNYPPIPADLSTYDLGSFSDDEGDVKDDRADSAPAESPKRSKIPPDPNDRLAVCEKCALAFCRVCFQGWHGPYVRCYPRDPNELSADEKASYEFIRLNTSPCPYCNSPTQKTMGCNHMICFQCSTHYCYLCSSWLDAQNPYQHFNLAGTECYQRLWELEEGDNGQGPADGRGFAGNRRWERMALELAREVEAEEAAVAVQAEEQAAAAQVDEDARVARALEAEDEDPDPRRPGEQVNARAARPREAPVIAGMGRVDLNANMAADVVRPPINGNARRQRNPFPARPRAAGAANVVRNHERGQAPRPAVRLDDDDQNQAEIQRFLDLALRDEEDGWDSDELGDDDAGFRIR